MPCVSSHKSADNHPICSARVAADWRCYRDQRAVPFRLGEINTHNTLNQADNTAPALLEAAADKPCWLTDWSYCNDRYRVKQRREVY